MNSRIEGQAEKIILKCRPSILFLITEPLGTIVFGWFGYLMIRMYLTGHVSFPIGGGIVSETIFWIFFGIFFAIAFYCLACLIGARTIIVTDENFIIKRPLLLFKQNIPLNSIETIEEKPYKSSIMYVSPYRFGLDTLGTYNGTKVIIGLNNSKKIKLKSEYFSGFEKLEGAFRKLRELKKIK
jgi:hypothetical protein